jgi:hypothetical protein
MRNRNLTRGGKTVIASKDGHLTAWVTLKGTLEHDKQGAKAC